MPPKQQQPGGEVINLAAVDHQQLVGLQERTQADIEKYAQSLQFFGRSSAIYLSSGRAIRELNASKEGQPLMLPLTQSLYVAGNVASVDQVLVDIGTGYYVEMTTEQGQDFCTRKFDKLQEAMKGVQEILRSKQNQLIQIKKALADRMQGLAHTGGDQPMPGP